MEALFNTSIGMEQISSVTGAEEELETDIEAQDPVESMESNEQVSGIIQSVPLSKILYSKHNVVLNNEILRDFNLSYHQLGVDVSTTDLGQSNNRAIGHWHIGQMQVKFLIMTLRKMIL